MLRIIIILFSFIVSFTSCKDDKSKNENTTRHIIEASSYEKRININLPNRFINITDLDFLAENENISDDVWVECVDIRDKYPKELNVFVDTINFKTEILLTSVTRINIEENIKGTIRQSVPTVKLNQVFPPETDYRKIISETNNKKINGIIYYKRNYIISNLEKEKSYLTTYLVSTSTESIVTSVSSNRETKFDKYILEITVSRR